MFRLNFQRLVRGFLKKQDVLLHPGSTYRLLLLDFELFFIVFLLMCFTAKTYLFSYSIYMEPVISNYTHAHRRIRNCRPQQLGNTEHSIGAFTSNAIHKVRYSLPHYAISFILSFLNRLILPRLIISVSSHATIKINREDRVIKCYSELIFNPHNQFYILLFISLLSPLGVY